ncbi:hypothetical protein AO368_0463 [Moraxella catarrhalis]|nr:hypothetical protein AO368_0463 [Moraxella catarrhalis]
MLTAKTKGIFFMKFSFEKLMRGAENQRLNDTTLRKFCN